MVLSGPASPRHDQHLPAARLPPLGRSGSCRRGRGRFVVAIPHVHAPEVMCRPQKVPGRQDTHGHKVVHVVVAVTRVTKFSSTLTVPSRTSKGGPCRTGSWIAARPARPAPIMMIACPDIQIIELLWVGARSLSCPLVPLALKETWLWARVEGLDRWSQGPRRDVRQKIKYTALRLLVFATETRICQYLCLFGGGPLPVQ